MTFDIVVRSYHVDISPASDRLVEVTVASYFMQMLFENFSGFRIKDKAVEPRAFVRRDFGRDDNRSRPRSDDEILVRFSKLVLPHLADYSLDLVDV